MLALASLPGPRRERLGHGPAHSKSGVQGYLRKSHLFCPLHHRLSPSLVLQNAIVAAVVRLLLHRRPATIPGTVIAVVVGISVQRVPRRGRRSHVGKEVNEAVFAQPALTDPD